MRGSGEPPGNDRRWSLDVARLEALNGNARGQLHFLDRVSLNEDSDAASDTGAERPLACMPDGEQHTALKDFRWPRAGPSNAGATDVAFAMEQYQMSESRARS
jgi:hypothetical protein